MATSVTRQDTFESWRVKTNQISTDLGTVGNLNAFITDHSSLVAAINELVVTDIGTVALSNFTATTLRAALNELRNSSITIGGNKTFSGNTVLQGTLGLTGDLAVNTNKIVFTASTGSAAFAGTLGSVGDFAVNSTKFTVAGATGNTVVDGTLLVNGATTIIKSPTLTITDILARLGNVTTPTDLTAAGGGIILKGASDKSIIWSASNGWTSSEPLNVATGKTYKVAGADVLGATTLGASVVNSSLQQVGTIGTGVWQGSLVASTYGGTGVNNGGRTLTWTVDNVAFAAQAGGSSVVLPATGTLATLTGSETFTNKTLTNPVLNVGSGTLVLPFGTVPAQTAEGSIFWDSDDDQLTVGTASGRKTLVNNDRLVSTSTGLTGGGNLSADRTLALTGQALALHNLASTGIVVRSAADTFVTRALTQGTGVTVTNGDGVAGAPTIAIGQSVATNADVTFNSVVAGTGKLSNGKIEATSGDLTIVAGTGGKLVIGSPVSYTTSTSIAAKFNAFYLVNNHSDYTGAPTRWYVDTAGNMTLLGNLNVAGTTTFATISGSVDYATQVTGKKYYGIIRDTAANQASPANNDTTGDTLWFRGAQGLTVAVGSNDSTYGDNVLIGIGSGATLDSPVLTTPVVGSAGATFNGTTGTTVLKASAAASGTLTLPATTGTLAITSDVTGLRTFKTIVISGQSDVVAGNNADTLTFAAGQVDATPGILLTTSGQTITFSHANSSALAGAYGGGNGIGALTVDTYGHVTAITPVTFLTTINGTPNQVAVTPGVAGVVTLSTPQDLATTSDPTFRNLTVSNLTVNGTTTTVNSTVYQLADPILQLGGVSAPAVDDGKDRGIEFRWHNGTVAKTGFFGFDRSAGKMTFVPDSTNTAEVVSGTKGEIDANLDWSNLLNVPVGAGVQGATGTQGTQGRQGIQGVQGTQGVQSPQGTTGTQGAAGFVGSNGAQGIQGVQGANGSNGTQGTNGANGTQGTAGSNGTQGATGSNGANGAQGIQGITGAGTTGSQGTAGSNGTQGATGTTGSQGTVGTQGAAGGNGTNGTQGATGATGAGTQGATGTAGGTGSQGTQGPAGPGANQTLNTNSDVTFNSVTAGGFNATSSLRYKTNIQPLQGALDTVTKLNGVTYDLIDGTKLNEIGLIAEDVRLIVPSVVSLKDGEPDAVDYGRLSAVLIEAVKDILNRLEALEKDHAAYR